MNTFTLDTFQKESISKIEKGENILVTAPTGSGKTLCAVHAIKHALSLGKKVIYTAPIKSLSNQKYYEFKKKFKGWSVGIVTGDVKFRMDADLIIMTAEILRNQLYKESQLVSTDSFDEQKCYNSSESETESPDIRYNTPIAPLLRPSPYVGSCTNLTIPTVIEQTKSPNVQFAAASMPDLQAIKKNDRPSKRFAASDLFAQLEMELRDWSPLSVDKLSAMSIAEYNTTPETLQQRFSCLAVPKPEKIRHEFMHFPKRFLSMGNGFTDTKFIRETTFEAKDVRSDNDEKQNDPFSSEGKQLGCVVMDEVHFINDPDRGTVWEETLVLLPKSVRLVLLSATVENATELSEWLTKIKGVPCHAIGKRERVVPLTHFMYFAHTKMRGLSAKEKRYINKNTNNLVHLRGKTFNGSNYDKMKGLAKKFFDPNISKVGCVKSLASFLQKRAMLPSLFFVFSRKMAQQFAYGVGTLFNTKREQSKVEKLVIRHLHLLKGETETSMKRRDVYLRSDVFPHLLRLWKSGVAYHHSGVQSVYKELVELLCNEGLIKVLFATETFAVGINAPIKTVVFTGLRKYSNEGPRFLKSAEYSQMAGRAGRRGLDKFGNVIVLANFLEFPKPTEMREIVCGKSARVQSRFKVTYQFVLKMSLIQTKHYALDSRKHRELSFADFEASTFARSIKKHECRDEWHRKIRFLTEHGYLDPDGKVSAKGCAAAMINEMNAVLGVDMITNGCLDGLNVAELVGLFSIFLNTRCMTAELRTNPDYAQSARSLRVSDLLKERLIWVEQIKNELKGDSDPSEWSVNYDMVEYAYRWVQGVSYQNLYFDNYVGTFVKDMLRLDNFMTTLEGVLELLDKPKVLCNVKKAHQLLVRSIVSPESLYISKR